MAILPDHHILGLVWGSGVWGLRSRAWSRVRGLGFRDWASIKVQVLSPKHMVIQVSVPPAWQDTVQERNVSAKQPQIRQTQKITSVVQILDMCTATQVLM